MCGVNAIISFSGQEYRAAINNMQKATKHRGPDFSEIVNFKLASTNCYLGNNRLQVIDQDENSNQPFVSSCGNFAITYNGEIYNHELLRNKLINLGVDFRTRSDTEVLLNWLIQYGSEGISQLNGMFSFVFIDKLSNKFLIARDRHGIKPLYYSKNENLFIASSEIKGILSSKLIPKELNHKQIPYYLTYKYCTKPETFYKNIWELMPGEIIEINEHSVRHDKIHDSKAEAEKASLEDTIIDSVISQYSVDQGAGLLLSGGVDSTLILAILRNELNLHHIPSYSIVHDKIKYGTDDQYFARMAAKKFDADHREIKVDTSCLNHFEDYIQSIDQPIADSGAFLTWLISKEISTSYKVVLSGAGADELFGGYQRHLAFYKYLENRQGIRFMLTKSAKHLPSGIHSFIDNLKKFGTDISSDPNETYDKFISLGYFKNYFNVNNTKLNVYDLKSALLADQKNYLVSDVLKITDNAAMQHGVEVRVPYLDNKVVTIANAMSAEALMSKGTKWPLKNMLKKYDAPQKLIHRKKAGFGLPSATWFRSDQNKWIFEGLKTQNSLLHNHMPFSLTNTILHEHLRGAKNNAIELWGLLVLDAWLTKEFT